MKPTMKLLFICLMLISTSSFAQDITNNTPPPPPNPADAFCNPDIKQFIKTNMDNLITSDGDEIVAEIKPQPSVAPTSAESSSSGTCGSMPSVPLDKLDLMYNQIVSGSADAMAQLAETGGQVIDNIMKLKDSAMGAAGGAAGSLAGIDFGSLDMGSLDCASLVSKGIDAARSQIDVGDYIDPTYEIKYIGDVGINTDTFNFEYDIDTDVQSVVSDLHS
jgi:hypothetical protein